MIPSTTISLAVNSCAPLENNRNLIGNGEYFNIKTSPLNAEFELLQNGKYRNAVENFTDMTETNKNFSPQKYDAQFPFQQYRQQQQQQLFRHQNSTFNQSISTPPSFPCPMNRIQIRNPFDDEEDIKEFGNRPNSYPGPGNSQRMPLSSGTDSEFDKSVLFQKQQHRLIDVKGLRAPGIQYSFQQQLGRHLPVCNPGTNSAQLSWMPIPRDIVRIPPHDPSSQVFGQFKGCLPPAHNIAPSPGILPSSQQNIVMVPQNFPPIAMMQSSIEQSRSSSMLSSVSDNLQPQQQQTCAKPKKESAKARKARERSAQQQMPQIVANTQGMAHNSQQGNGMYSTDLRQVTESKPGKSELQFKTSRSPLISGRKSRVKPMPSKRICSTGQCSICSLLIEETRMGICCTAIGQGCEKIFHSECVSLLPNAFKQFCEDAHLEWICPTCAKQGGLSYCV